MAKKKEKKKGPVDCLSQALHSATREEEERHTHTEKDRMENEERKKKYTDDPDDKTEQIKTYNQEENNWEERSTEEGEETIMKGLEEEIGIERRDERTAERGQRGEGVGNR